jgi:hypothetical protein
LIPIFIWESKAKAINHEKHEPHEMIAEANGLELLAHLAREVGYKCVIAGSFSKSQKYDLLEGIRN